MRINKGTAFSERSIYVDYPFEAVMFRWDNMQKKIFIKFYGRTEDANSIPHDSWLFNEALRFGNEITEAEYNAGRPKPS